MSQKRCSAKTDPEIADFFDQCAQKGLMVDFPPEERATLARFFEFWNLQPHFRVLEPGCGAGRLTAELARAIGPEGEIYACDLSGEMLRLAEARALPPQVHFVQKTVLQVERPDQWFDRVICLNVFPHFPDPPTVLREFARLLKPGGQFWINHFEGRESLNRFHHDAAPEVSDHALPCPFTMRKLMQDAGFQVAMLQDQPDFYALKAVRIG